MIYCDHVDTEGLTKYLLPGLRLGNSFEDFRETKP